MSEKIDDQLVALLPRLRRFARILTGSADEADDLVQDAIERALSRRHQWRPGTRLDRWMFRIIQTVRLNQLRAIARRQPFGPADAEEKIGVDGARCLEAKLTLNAVRDAIKKLSEKRRAVLVLVCVEGFTYRETAEILDIPVGTVMSRLADARFALHRMISGAPDDTTDNVVEIGAEGDRPMERRRTSNSR